MNAYKVDRESIETADEAIVELFNYLVSKGSYANDDELWLLTKAHGTTLHTVMEIMASLCHPKRKWPVSLSFSDIESKYNLKRTCFRRHVAHLKSLGLIEQAKDPRVTAKLSWRIAIISENADKPNIQKDKPQKPIAAPKSNEWDGYRDLLKGKADKLIGNKADSQDIIKAIEASIEISKQFTSQPNVQISYVEKKISECGDNAMSWVFGFLALNAAIVGINSEERISASADSDLVCRIYSHYSQQPDFSFAFVVSELANEIQDAKLNIKYALRRLEPKANRVPVNHVCPDIQTSYYDRLLAYNYSLIDRNYHLLNALEKQMVQEAKKGNRNIAMECLKDLEQIENKINKSKNMEMV